MSIKKSKSKRIKKIAVFIVNELSQHGGYVYHESSHGTIYIRFKEPLLGSIRISDHSGNQKYRYSYNIRFDIERSHTTRDGGITRHYIKNTDVKKILPVLLDKKQEYVSAQKNNGVERKYNNFKGKSFQKRVVR